MQARKHDLNLRGVDDLDGVVMDTSEEVSSVG